MSLKTVLIVMPVKCPRLDRGTFSPLKALSRAGLILLRSFPPLPIPGVEQQTTPRQLTGGQSMPGYIGLRTASYPWHVPR